MKDARELRIAMLGMIPGNGHPYSWSAIINGYDPIAMARCPYPVIPKYLGERPFEQVRIDGARVTHVWTDDPTEAAAVAEAARIETIVARPEDVIGQVDAVIISTDDGNDHVRRARAFVEAGLPVFIDKPLAINLPDLIQFVDWHRAGRRILSTSGMRYMPEMSLIREHPERLGALRWITSFTCKSWERYGIHALESVYPVLGPGFVTVQTQHRTGEDIVHLRHRTGALLTVAAIEDAVGSFGSVHFHGTGGEAALKLGRTYDAFRAQLQAFIAFVKTGRHPFPFQQTVELMLLLIAGIRSRNEGGRSICVDALWKEIGDDFPDTLGDAPNL